MSCSWIYCCGEPFEADCLVLGQAQVFSYLESENQESREMGSPQASRTSVAVQHCAPTATVETEHSWRDRPEAQIWGKASGSSNLISPSTTEEAEDCKRSANPCTTGHADTHRDSSTTKSAAAATGSTSLPSAAEDHIEVKAAEYVTGIAARATPAVSSRC